MPNLDTTSFDSDKRRLLCRGDWDLKHIPALQSTLQKLPLPTSDDITLDGGDIEKMDSSGAWLLLTFQQQLEKKGLKPQLDNFSSEHQKLLALILARIKEEKPPQEVVQLNWLERIGRDSIIRLDDLREYLSFIGYLFYEFMRIARNPAQYRWNAIAGVIFRNGYEALSIIALLSFMIGVVIAYQMGVQLRSYGANVYIVDFLGLSILREFGPLLTAIMIAGRTGSSYTAQLGIMKINQEIDALDTMGVTPAELLLLPRIIGLFIALPLLTVWADIFGTLGGMFMANNMLNITPADFLIRFPSVIPLKTFIIGLGKAPVFALIISTIGCFEGMKVEGSAESIGRNTTKSVVLAIFYIIVADALFSIILSKLKL